MKNIALAFALLLGLANTGYGEDLAPPAGQVVLTVSGKIAATNGTGVAAFDLEMLRSLGVEQFATTTIWTGGTPTFEGVPLANLVERLGVTDGTLRAFAINDYTVDIPVTDAVDGGPMIAFRMDGADMSVRDKGPLWIVYPYDSNQDYRSEVIYSRSIWQLDRIEVVE